MCVHVYMYVCSLRGRRPYVWLQGSDVVEGLHVVYDATLDGDAPHAMFVRYLPVHSSLLLILAHTVGCTMNEGLVLRLHSIYRAGCRCIDKSSRLLPNAKLHPRALEYRVRQGAVPALKSTL